MKQNRRGKGSLCLLLSYELGSLHEPLQKEREGQKKEKMISLFV
jgi:hypothetical protein